MSIEISSTTSAQQSPRMVENRGLFTRLLTAFQLGPLSICKALTSLLRRQACPKIQFMKPVLYSLDIECP
jgi:hypothetical protein